MWAEFLARHLWRLMTMVALLAASSFFSGTETALFSLSRGQLQRLRHGSRAGQSAAALMNRPLDLLQGLLLGNMLVNVAYAGVAALITFDLLEADAPGGLAAVVFLAPLLVLILLGEVFPKMVAITYARRWAALAAAPATVFLRVAWPALWVLGRGLVQPLTRVLVSGRPQPSEITPEELAAVMALSAKRGAIGYDAHALLQEIIQLSDLRVSDIMVPRVDMVAYDIHDSPHGLAELFRRTHLRKIPVFDGDLDNVLGVIHAKRLLLHPDAPLRELVTQAPFVPEAASVERVLLQFRLTRTQMALVVDEYGGTAGLVTLEDVLEEVVGDIPDPHQRARDTAVEDCGGGTYLLDGDLAIHEWADAFKMNLAGKRISTIGGFVTARIGRIPQVSDTVTYRNLRFTVIEMRRRRVGRLKLELLGETDTETPHAG